MTKRAPIVLATGKGRSYPAGDVRVVFKADGDETRNRYALSEWWLEPYTRGPGAHEHDEDDVNYVLEGTVSFFVGNKWIDAPAGSLVIAPGGTPHDFENRTGKRAGFLNFKTPGEFEPDVRGGIAEWFRTRPEADTRTANAPRGRTAKAAPAKAAKKPATAKKRR
jgi:mannose-6-phosphate isomerase-like protein (cupin superfamily)